MQSEKISKILEACAEVALDFTDGLEIFLTAGYGTSVGRIEYHRSQKRRSRDREKLHREEQRRARHAYSSLVSRLKRDGLIAIQIRNKRKYFGITAQGKKKLLFFTRNTAQLPSTKYQGKEGSTLLIVTFDIPERERRKRDWLRASLRHLHFSMVQKSVWFGKVTLPASFLHDIRDLNVAQYVEIFEITKTGSLSHLL